MSSLPFGEAWFCWILGDYDVEMKFRLIHQREESWNKRKISKKFLKSSQAGSTSFICDIGCRWEREKFSFILLWVLLLLSCFHIFFHASNLLQLWRWVALLVLLLLLLGIWWRWVFVADFLDFNFTIVPINIANCAALKSQEIVNVSSIQLGRNFKLKFNEASRAWPLTESIFWLILCPYISL